MQPQQSSISPVLNNKPNSYQMAAIAPDGTLPEYKQTDKDYMGGLQKLLQNAWIQRERQYEEFDYQTYSQRFIENRRKAASVIQPIKNKGDVTITAGTIEQKLDAVLSAVNNLNLSPEIHAYDENDNHINLAGDSLEDILEQVAEYDGDDEKKLVRQRELLVQGEVFVEEKWVQYFKKKKKLGAKFTGNFQNNDWTSRLEKFYEGPNRIVKYGPNIYLGDITQFDMKQQPYFFEVYADGYENLKSIFGSWEMWKYVPQKFQPISSVASGTGNGGMEHTPTNAVNSQGVSAIIDYRWILQSNVIDECEVIVYQDKWNDEFNIIINGVMMLPAGFPLSEISPNGEYTVEKQVFKSTNPHFAYGRGFIQTVQQAAALLDEMLKLAVLKTRRSFQPPFINTSKRAISPRVLQAGQITMGIAPDVLKQLGELSEGVTPSEFGMIKEMSDVIDRITVSPQFAGQQGNANTTATEVMQMQQAAKMTLGLVVFACTQLELKISYLRLWNVLENWFKPIDKVATTFDTNNDDGTTSTTTKYSNKYRTVSRPRAIPGEGRGQRQTIPTDGPIPSSANIRLSEFQDQQKLGYPTQKIYIQPDDLKDACKKWFIIITPKEKETSDFNKTMFRQKLQDALLLTQFGSQINTSELEDEFSRAWDDNNSKLFIKKPAGPQAPVGPLQAGDPNAAAAGNTKGIPTQTAPKSVPSPTT